MNIVTKPWSLNEMCYVYIFFEGSRVYRLSLFSLMNPTLNTSVLDSAQCHSFDSQLDNIAQEVMPSMNKNPLLAELA